MSKKRLKKETENEEFSVLNSVNKCPKCNGEMERGRRMTGYLTIAIRFTKKHDSKGDMIIPFYCKNCGYIELYKIPPAPTPETFFKKCSKCGKEIPIASEECSYCGTKQPED